MPLEAALAAGGRDNGPPGDRGYHPGYYAAYVLDPDGNNVEAVFHGAAGARRRIDAGPALAMRNGRPWRQRGCWSLSPDFACGSR